MQNSKKLKAFATLCFIAVALCIFVAVINNIRDTRETKKINQKALLSDLLSITVEDEVDYKKCDELFGKVLSLRFVEKQLEAIKDKMDNELAKVEYGTTFEVITTSRMLEDPNSVYEEFDQINEQVKLWSDDYSFKDICAIVADEMFDMATDAEVKEYRKLVYSEIEAAGLNDTTDVNCRYNVIYLIYSTEKYSAENYYTKSDNIMKTQVIKEISDYETIIDLATTKDIIEKFIKIITVKYPYIHYEKRNATITQELLKEDPVYARGTFLEIKKDLELRYPGKNAFEEAMKQAREEVYYALTEDEMINLNAMIADK